MTNHNDWIPQFGPTPGQQFKWGLNGETEELTIWEVGGPGDGFPSHSEQLTSAWGRDDHHRAGDVLGMAFVRDSEIVVSVFAAVGRDGHGVAAELPVQIRTWAAAHFPGHRLARSSR